MKAAQNNARINRRTFFKRIGYTATGAMVGSVYPVFIEPRRVQINHIHLSFPSLPRAFDGLTIAHMTDLHHSRYVSARYLDHCIATANALQPDLFAFTGDYLTHSRSFSTRRRLAYGQPQEANRYADTVAGCLGRARARHGVFACLGNHDHWYGGNTMTALIEKVGVPVLRNSATAIRINGATLPVVGLGDHCTEGVDETKAFAQVTEPHALVLMHNPDTFEHWTRPGTHFILSGHTHGGQVNLPWIGPPLVPSDYGQKYAHGLFRKNTSAMYVNRGVGVIFPPVRFNCRPEIAIFHLHSA